MDLNMNEAREMAAVDYLEQVRLKTIHWLRGLLDSAAYRPNDPKPRMRHALFGTTAIYPANGQIFHRVFVMCGSQKARK